MPCQRKSRNLPLDLDGGVTAATSAKVKLCEAVAGIESWKAGGRAALKRLDVVEPEIARTWTSASRRPVQSAV